MLNDVVILIPSHSLEDFPTDLGEKPAEGLLNAFAVAWHPWLLAQTRSLPGWHRADSPPEPTAQRLILVPTCCDDRLETDWLRRQREAGSFVVTGVHKRDELLAEVLAAARDWSPIPPADGGTTPLVGETPDGTSPISVPSSPESLDPELVADFLALGTTHLLVELLSRQMHYFGEIDEMRLRREAVEAAEACVGGRHDDARQRLANCFEALHEARERFYPVDAYLLDMCLLVPSLADDTLPPLLTDSKPISFLMTVRDAEQLAREKPEVAKLLREAVQRETVELLGGEWSEVPSPIMPIESVLCDLRRGHAACRQWFRTVPTTWARRRFGLSPLLPQLLNKFGYTAACHFLLDDGIYPDAEYSKLRWEGCDNVTIDAISRLPLAADSSTSYLRLPQRMAESMQQDQAAGLILARWPDVRSPFFRDLVRGVKYSPVIGRFATFKEFFERTDTPMRHTRYEAGEYLAPFLTRAVAAREPAPIGRFIEHFERRQRFDRALWLRSLAAILRGRRLHEIDATAAEFAVEAAGPDVWADQTPSSSDHATSESTQPSAAAPAVQRAEDAIQQLLDSGRRELVQTVMHGAAPSNPGLLIVNPLSFARRIPLANLQRTVEVPGAGFVWLPNTEASHEHSKTPLVEGNVLRNEFFEVHISPDTGGIQRLKEYGRKPNRLSQQLAFRFPRERTITVVEDDREFAERSFYSDIRGVEVEVVSTGPRLGIVRTRGEIFDQKTDAALATFQQTFRLWRGRRLLDIEVELDVVKMPEGDPWSNYFGVRWAWLDMTAAVTRSVLGTAQPIGQERFESPHYIEIADEDTRTTILTHGLPFHRKTGRRMCDSLLIVEGEARRRFRFSIAFECPYPMQAALDATCEPIVIPTDSGPPRCGSSGWFFHLDAPNVQLTRLTDLMDEPRSDASAWEAADPAAVPAGTGFAVRLQETEGRLQSVALRCFRTPLSARQRDFIGRTTGQPRIDGDGVNLTLNPFEICDLELRFDLPTPPTSSANADEPADL